MFKIFLDTEFTGLHQHTTLISIGLAAENGSLFYAELTDYDASQMNPWLAQNVLPLLSGGRLNEHVQDAQIFITRGTSETVSIDLRRWFRQFGEKNQVEIWADVLAWDWVLFCELFGGAFAIPDQIHYIPRDLSTMLYMKSIDPDIPREELGSVEWQHPKLKLAKHHALYDALLEKSVFENLNR